LSEQHHCSCLFRIGKFVCCHHYGDAASTLGSNEFGHKFAAVDVEAGGGFVEQQNLCFAS